MVARGGLPAITQVIWQRIDELQEQTKRISSPSHSGDDSGGVLQHQSLII